jgi:hypothetical protein
VTRAISGRSASAQLTDVLQAAVLGEFLHPGARLTLHTQALVNGPVADNRQNAFRTLLPDFGYREVLLIDAIRELLARGSSIDLAYRDSTRSAAFLEQLEAAFRLDPPAGPVRVLHAGDLPGTGLLGGGFFLGGEFEWTTEGLVAGPGSAVFQVAAEEVEAVRSRWSSYWEGKSRATRTL